MKNIMTRILNFLLKFKPLKYLLKRPSWSSNVRIVEWYKIFIASIWVLYLALEIEQFKRFALPIYKFLSNYNFLKAIISNLYENRVILLLALTIPAILDIIFKKVSYKKLSYKKLNPILFPEYDLDDYSFQTHLVEFLNSSDSIHNVFWLDGSWGSGKTFFIKTFFENQIYKKKEIYYISCFGIKTREQAEKILINEIEKQSILGNLDFIPLVGGVFKWFFKTVGTDLMKRDSIIIFDDFERVSYTGKSDNSSDNPSDYNDLLDYIDYLSENKRFKIIVILNSEEIKSTKKNLIDNKFKLNHNRMVSTEEVIDNILKKSKLRDDDFGKILSLIFKIYYADIEERVVQDKNKDLKVKKSSLREFQKSLEELLNIIESGRLLPYSGRKKSNYVDYIAVYIVDCMNGRMGTDSILVSFFEFFDGIYEIDEYDQSYELDAYFHFEMLEKIVGLSSLDSLPTSKEEMYFNLSYENKLIYYFQLLSCLWEVGLGNLFISKTDNKVYYNRTKELISEPQKCLVEIYYDVFNNNIKDDYRINDVKKLEDTRYQNFIKHCLPTRLDRQITINNIPLDKLIQESFEIDGSLSKFQ